MWSLGGESGHGQVRPAATPSRNDRAVLRSTFLRSLIRRSGGHWIFWTRSF